MKDFRVKYKITNNPVAKTVTVGDRVFDKPHLRRFPEHHYSLKAEIVGQTDHLISIKDINAFYCDLLGPRFNYRFQAANYHTWIAPHMTRRTGNMLRLPGRHWRQYSDGMVSLAHNVLPYIHEAERDNLYHLIPTIVAFQESPQNIRRLIGKGAWKRFAALSPTRATKILQVRVETGIQAPDDLVRLLDVPSGVLPYMVPKASHFIAARIATRKRHAEFVNALLLVRDTKRMLGDRFNPNWSYRRMLLEHDAAAKAANAKRYSAESFAAPWSVNVGDYTATLLISPREIADEGAMQHHCVASYAELAKTGRYAVLRLEGPERATIGSALVNGSWRLEQCYEAHNVAVSETTTDIAKSVVRMLERDRKAGVA